MFTKHVSIMDNGINSYISKMKLKKLIIIWEKEIKPCIN